MKTIKSICVKCYADRNAPEVVLNDHWKDGSIMCPHAENINGVYGHFVHLPPPNWCPFILEHLVLSK